MYKRAFFDFAELTGVEKRCTPFFFEYTNFLNKKILKWLEKVPEDHIAVMDFGGVTYLGYSVVKTLISYHIDLLYEKRYRCAGIHFWSGVWDIESILDGFGDLLFHSKKTVIVGWDGNENKLYGYLDPERNPCRTKKEEKKRTKLIKLYNLIKDKVFVYTTDLVIETGIKAPYVNGLLKELEEMRLIQRTKHLLPHGGFVMSNKVIL